MKEKTAPIAMDLFSGCGGLTLGLKKAGFNVVGAVEIDSLSVETYKANHDDVFVWQTDIGKLKISAVKKQLDLKAGDLDLLAGCPPCQGFSSIRTLNGSRDVPDSRNDLIFEFLRFVKELRPKTIMMENVPGLACDSRFIDFCAVVAELGYQYSHEILDAADYGVPQRRHRLIFLAGRYGKIQFARPARKKKTVREAISTMPIPGKRRDPLHDYNKAHTLKVMDLIRHIPKNGGSRIDLPEEFKLECHKRCTGFKDVYGRMAWDDVAPTITCGCFNPSKGRFLHPEQDRAITLREAALLQGFPRYYKFAKTKNRSAIAMMIGNALPPEFIFRHALRIKKHLDLP